MLNFNNFLRHIASSLFIALFAITSVSAVPQNFTSKDFSHWLTAAYIAEATYNSTDDIKSVLNRHGYRINQIQQLEGYAVGFILASNVATKQQLIAVRGTSNIKNIMVDAAFVLVPDKLSGVNIHQGFLLSARDIYQQLQPLIKPGYSINTIGHSLGGATALILAMMFDAQGFSVGEVITFGQPKVTNISGSRKFKHLDVIRIVTPKDIVPLVPPIDPMDLMKFSIFWHQGTEILLYEKREYSVLTGVNSMLRAKDFLNDIPSEQHLSNHFMSTYIHYLQSKLDSPIEVEYKSDFSFSNWFGSSQSNSKP